MTDEIVEEETDMVRRLGGTRNHIQPGGVCGLDGITDAPLGSSSSG